MFPRVVWPALLLYTAHASVAPRSSSSWKDTPHNDNELETLQEALSGLEYPDDAPMRPARQQLKQILSSRGSNSKPVVKDDEDVDFKQKKDWWKDPLSAFDQVEAEEEIVQAVKEEPVDEPVVVDNVQGEEEEEESFAFRIPPVWSTKDVTKDVEESRVADNIPEERKSEPEPVVRPNAKSKSSFFKEPETTKHFKPGTEIAQPSDTRNESSALSLSFLLATLIPSSLRTLLGRVSGVQALALLVIGRQINQWRPHIIKFLQKNKEPETDQGTTAAKTKPSRPTPTTREDAVEGLAEDHESDEDDDVPEYFRNNPRTRAVFKKKEPVKPKAADKQNNRDSRIPALSGGWTEGIFGQRRPSAKQLMEQVHALQLSCEQAEIAKSNLEQQYEKASWQLQTSQSDFDKLKQTTKYLQAQLRDNEEMLDRVVKQEQRKGKEELAKMKEAMIKVVEREREAMREEFIKQAAELEQLWKQSKNKQQHQHTYDVSTSSDDHNDHYS